MSFDTTQNTLATNPYGDDKEVILKFLIIFRNTSPS